MAKLQIGDTVALKVPTIFGNRPTGRVIWIIGDVVHLEKDGGGTCEAMRHEVKRIACASSAAEK